jgi:uncharacterized membrane protein YidH (DUF202 family)
MARFFGNISFVNILFLGLIAAMVIMPELGFCDVPVLGKINSKAKEVTDGIRTVLLTIMGLSIAAAGLAHFFKPEMLSAHISKIVATAIILMISYGATEVVNWVAK